MQWLSFLINNFLTKNGKLKMDNKFSTFHFQLNKMKNTITWILKVMLGLSGLMLIFSGLQWGFAPESNFEAYKVVIDGIAGRSMIQTDISAPLITGGIFLILFALKGNEWFWPMFTFGLAYLVVRAVTLFTIGFNDGVLIGVVFETVVLALLITLKKIRE